MDPVLLRVAAIAVLLGAVLLAGRWWQRRDGALRPAGTELDRHHLEAVGLDLSDAAAGAVLLGSPTCAPCDGVKEVLGRLQSERPGFRWVYADAADHLELAEAHRILRIPTLLVVAPGGRILARSSGVPRADELRRVLDDGSGLGGSFAA